MCPWLLVLLRFLILYYHTQFTLHYSDNDRRLRQNNEGQTEGGQTMRLSGVPGESCGPRAWREIQEVSRVQSGDLLLQGPRRAALSRARESVRGADSDLRPPELQGAGRYRYLVSAVQGGDVLQQEAQDEALVSAREQVRGAVLV